MPKDTELAVQLKRAVNGRSVRSLAEQTGWGRSTIHEWLTGSRLLTDSQLDDLLDAVEAPLGTRQELHRIRVAARSPSVEPPVPPVEPDGPVEMTPVRRARRPVWMRSVVATVLAFGLLGAGYALGRSGLPERGASAEIAYTLGEGVFTRSGPSMKTEKMSSLFDGQQVYVVCVASYGDAVTDNAQGKTRTVWALLSTGVWVPDLYLNTPKNWAPPQSPPAPLRSC